MEGEAKWGVRRGRGAKWEVRGEAGGAKGRGEMEGSELEEIGYPASGTLIMNLYKENREKERFQGEDSSIQILLKPTWSCGLRYP